MSSLLTKIRPEPGEDDRCFLWDLICNILLPVRQAVDELLAKGTPQLAEGTGRREAGEDNDTAPLRAKELQPHLRSDEGIFTSFLDGCCGFTV